MAQRRFALCIGNDEYTLLGRLKCAVNDAKTLAESLQKLDFDVQLLENTNHDKIISVLDILENKISEYDAILLFYAGHGFQFQGENLLAPIDFDPMYSAAEAQYKSLRLSDMMQRLNVDVEKTKIIILDACRKEYKTRGINVDGFAPMSAPQGSLIAFSTSPGQVAKENTSHGKYTEILLKYIDLPHEPIESVFKRVRTDLVGETDGNQIPWEHTSLIGDFYINPGKVEGYSDTAFADAYFSFHKGSKIEAIVRELKTHYWPNQRKAIGKLAHLDYNETFPDELFVLGRNIYQSADGNSSEARKFIVEMKENRFIPEEKKIHIINGLVYEIYFNHENKLREKPKYEFAMKAINLLEGVKYFSCCEFISMVLKRRRAFVYYIPGSKKMIDVTIKLGEIDTSYIDSSTGEISEYDGYSVEDIIWQEESIYFNTFDNEKPVVSPYDQKVTKFSFEFDLTNKMIISEGYLRINYEGGQDGTNTLLLIPDTGYSVFRKSDEE